MSKELHLDLRFVLQCMCSAFHLTCSIKGRSGKLQKFSAQTRLIKIVSACSAKLLKIWCKSCMNLLLVMLIKYVKLNLELKIHRVIFYFFIYFLYLIIFSDTLIWNQSRFFIRINLKHLRGFIQSNQIKKRKQRFLESSYLYYHS